MRTYRNQILAVAGVAALALAVPFSIARAQEASESKPTAPTQQGGQFGGPTQQGGQFGGPTQQGGQFGGPGAPPAGPGGGAQLGLARGAGMVGGGAVSMALDTSHLYIVRGNQIFKVNKSDLRVSGVGELPQPMPAGGAPAGRAGGARAGGGE